MPDFKLVSDFQPTGDQPETKNAVPQNSLLSPLRFTQGRL